MAVILMVNLLKQPYPTEESVSRRIVKSVVVGAFVGLFLLAFQPFGLDDWQTPAKSIKILGFGGVTLFVMLANYLALPLLFPKTFSDERWTVGKEIIRVFTFISIIAFGNKLYLDRLMPQQQPVGGWLWGIGVTFLIGMFPTVGLVLLNYITQLKKYSHSATTFQIHQAKSKEQVDEQQESTSLNPSLPAILTLVADNEKDRLVLPADDLLFIESSDNYCTVVYLKNGQTVKPLLRSSLSRLEKQIDRPHIVRCHRSYVVNLDRVERVTGNAQGYKLHLWGGQSQIPVARQYNETLVAELKAL